MRLHFDLSETRQHETKCAKQGKTYGVIVCARENPIANLLWRKAKWKICKKSDFKIIVWFLSVWFFSLWFCACYITAVQMLVSWLFWRIHIRIYKEAEEEPFTASHFCDVITWARMFLCPENVTCLTHSYLDKVFYFFTHTRTLSLPLSFYQIFFWCRHALGMVERCWNLLWTFHNVWYASEYVIFPENSIKIWNASSF